MRLLEATEICFYEMNDANTLDSQSSQPWLVKKNMQIWKSDKHGSLVNIMVRKALENIITTERPVVEELRVDCEKWNTI